MKFSFTGLALIGAFLATPVAIRAQHTPAVDRGNDSRFQQIIAKELAGQQEKIAELENRVETLEKLTYSGGGAEDRVVHTIVSGDTLSHIAQRYNVSVEALAAANGIRPDATIFVGELLTIPPSHGKRSSLFSDQPSPPQPQPAPTPGPQPAPPQPSLPSNGQYTVQKGDNLFRIAQRYGTTIDELIQLNGLRGETIYAGQKLSIPGRSSGATPGKPSTSNPYAGADSPPGQPQQPAAGSQTKYHYYEVNSGDNLESIATTFFTTPAEIRKLNKMAPDDSNIRAGQKLIVPTEKYFEYLRERGFIG